MKCDINSTTINKFMASNSFELTPFYNIRNYGYRIGANCLKYTLPELFAYICKTNVFLVPETYWKISLKRFELKTIR